MSDLAQQACSYAALILADDNVEITAEKLQTILKAAGIEDVEPIWTSLFAKALAGKDVKEILTDVGATGAAAAGTAGGGAAAGSGAAEAEAAPEEAKKVEEDEGESDEDLGLSLFD
ncbi:hypothetical protein KEM52_001944 [Ascosphaera acerosa]|nr:hypothetical protein KEM52_001944 [Ascosphaera acerosa]